MKRLTVILVLLHLGMVLQLTHAQVVEEKKMAFVTKTTATWCPPCGTYGWSQFESMLAEHDGNAVMVQLHPDLNSELYNDASGLLYQINESYGYIPSFHTDHVRTMGSIPSSIGTVNSVRDAVTSSIAIPPILNVNYNIDTMGNSVQVDVWGEFFQSDSGRFMSEVYILEDSVINYQYNQGDSAIHHNLLRAELDPDHEIVEGAVSAGFTFQYQRTISLEPDWVPENLNVFVLMYRRIGFYRELLNAYTRPLQQVTTTGLRESESLQLKVYPNPATTTVRIQLPEGTQRPTHTHVYDITGRLVHQQSFTTDMDVSTLSRGTYAIVVHTELGNYRGMIQVIR